MLQSAEVLFANGFNLEIMKLLPRRPERFLFIFNPFSSNDCAVWQVRIYIYIFGYLWAHSMEAGIDCFFFISSFDCPISASWRGTFLIPGFHLLALILSMAQMYWTVESWLTHHIYGYTYLLWPRSSSGAHHEALASSTWCHPLLILCLSLTQRLAAHDV